MRCPNCQVEVQEWHFYCQNCHVQIQGFRRETERYNSPRGRVERAGARVINALVGILLVSVLVLTGRAVPWKEIYAAIQGDASSLAKSETVSETTRTLRGKSDASHPEGKSSTAAKNNDGQKAKKDAVVESAKARAQKVEQLPTVDGQLQAQKVSLSTGPLQVDSATTAKSTDPAPKSESPGSNASANPVVEEKNARSGNGDGQVAITSDIPAKIYINGQYSGITPRTVKMNAGDLQIRLIADGYDDWTRRVKLNAKQQLGITASMKKKAAQ